MKILSADYVVPISRNPIFKGAVVVNNDKIIDLGQKAAIDKKYPDVHSLGFGGAILMPGLVNCHSHLELSILRGYLDHFDDDFASWLITLTKTRAEKLTNDDIKTSAVFGVLEGIKAGVTCFADIGRFGEAGFEALKISGLRGIVFQETEFSPDDKTADKDFDLLEEKYSDLAKRETDLVRVGISPHAPYTVSARLFTKLTSYSIENDVPLTIHAAESNEEKQLMERGTGFFAEIYRKESIDWKAPKTSSIKYLNDLGVMETRPLLAHCVDVSGSDLDLIVQSDSRIAHCPKSNAKFGHGVAPFKEFLSKKAKVGFGSDSVVSNNTCDIFEEARFATLLSRTSSTGQDFLNAQKIIETATIGGAIALGMENEIGTARNWKAG